VPTCNSFRNEFVTTGSELVRRSLRRSRERHDVSECPRDWPGMANGVDSQEPCRLLIWTKNKSSCYLFAIYTQVLELVTTTCRGRTRFDYGR
jgi:hypothetical protein